MIDSHMHINSLVVSDVFGEICKVNNDKNIDCVVNVGLNEESSREIVSIAEENKKFFATIGVHPLYIDRESLDFLYSFNDCDRVVAVGEIGLDSTSDNIELQKKYLIEQIEIANELCLPVIIHSNNMNREVIKIFDDGVIPKYGCVFHCFQPDLDILEYLISKGIYISFAGRVTYKTAKKSHEVLRRVPNELFLIETDSPYISPEPFRGLENHSSNIIYIAKKIAEVKGMDYDEVVRLTSENTKRLFKKIKN